MPILWSDYPTHYRARIGNLPPSNHPPVPAWVLDLLGFHYASGRVPAPRLGIELGRGAGAQLGGA